MGTTVRGPSKSKPFIWLLLALLPFWYGCEPDGPEAIEDYNVVVTNHYSSFNFATVRTYYLIDTVVACVVACNNCAAACLQEEDVKMMARCIGLDMDCAQICALSAAYLARNSEFAGQACDLCAQVCEACAAECSKHDDDHCRRCAEACRRCAGECRSMMSMAGA